jgi:hypothetical protein
LPVISCAYRWNAGAAGPARPGCRVAVCPGPDSMAASREHPSRRPESSRVQRPAQSTPARPPAGRAHTANAPGWVRPSQRAVSPRFCLRTRSRCRRRVADAVLPHEPVQCPDQPRYRLQEERLSDLHSSASEACTIQRRRCSSAPAHSKRSDRATAVGHRNDGATTPSAGVDCVRRFPWESTEASGAFVRPLRHLRSSR